MNDSFKVISIRNVTVSKLPKIYNFQEKSHIDKYIKWNTLVAGNGGGGGGGGGKGGGDVGGGGGSGDLETSSTGGTTLLSCAETEIHKEKLTIKYQ